MKKKRKIEAEVKKELLKSFVEGDVYENDDLIRRVMNVKSYQEAKPIMKEYKTIIVRQKRNI